MARKPFWSEIAKNATRVVLRRADDAKVVVLQIEPERDAALVHLTGKRFLSCCYWLESPGQPVALWAYKTLKPALARLRKQAENYWRNGFDLANDMDLASFGLPSPCESEASPAAAQAEPRWVW